MHGTSFDLPWQQIAFEEHRRTIEDRLTQCARLETTLHEAAPQWRFYPVVDQQERFQALPGLLEALPGRAPCAHQVAAGLVLDARHVHGRKVPGTQRPHEPGCITAISLDALAGLPRNQ